MRQSWPAIAARVCVTAQHREMLDQVLEILRSPAGLRSRPDDSGPDPGGQITARILTALDPILGGNACDMVVVQGDTTTTMAGALAAFYRGIPGGARGGRTAHRRPRAAVSRRDEPPGHRPPGRAAFRAHRGRRRQSAGGRHTGGAGFSSPAIPASMPCCTSPAPWSREDSRPAIGPGSMRQEADRRHGASPRELRRRHRAHLRGAGRIGAPAGRADRLPGAPQSPTCSTR